MAKKKKIKNKAETASKSQDTHTDGTTPPLETQDADATPVGRIRGFFKRKKKDPKPGDFKKHPARELVEVLMYGLALLVFFTRFVWQNFQIPTQSMENTLLIGDHIAANTFIFNGGPEWEKKIFPFREVQRGDVVVFKFPQNPREDWIKRCIGMPGDTVSLIRDQITINGEPLDEQYTYFKAPPSGPTTRDPDNRYYPLGYNDAKPGIENAEYRLLQNQDLDRFISDTRVSIERTYSQLRPEYTKELIKRLDTAFDGERIRIPEGFYLMMGDNRNRSRDSRSWGLVPQELVEGRAYFVWWSYGEDENSHKLTGFDLIWSKLRLPYTFWTRTHWPETFKLIK